MTPNVVALYATVIVLFTLLYFLLASIPFLFVKLDIPVVARLLRGLFSICPRLIAGAGTIAAIAFAITGGPLFAIEMFLLAVFAIAVRHWILPHMDANWSANAAGDRTAMRRLRLLHCAGMMATLAQITAVASSVQFIA